MEIWIKVDDLWEKFKNMCYINGYNMKKDILRYPRLDTILMVESFIQKKDGMFKKRKLWESLPKKMMYQTFCVIIDYLVVSHKISIDKEGKIGWIYYPKSNKNVKKDSSLFLK